jgi:hypothetical protein
MSRDGGWLRKSKRQRGPDAFEAYMAANYSNRDSRHPGYIALATREIKEGDPDWPGGDVAAEITQLYYRHACHGRPKRYARLVREILGFDDDDRPLARKIMKRRHSQ